MSRTHREIRSEAREVASALSRLAERALVMSPTDFLKVWRATEPRVLACLRDAEIEEGGGQNSIERLRNLTWEVAVTADLQMLHDAALERLAQLFSERIERRAQRGTLRSEAALGPTTLFGIG